MSRSSSPTPSWAKRRTAHSPGTSTLSIVSLDGTEKHQEGAADLPNLENAFYFAAENRLANFGDCSLRDTSKRWPEASNRATSTSEEASVCTGRIGSLKPNVQSPPGFPGPGAPAPADDALDADANSV